MILSVVGWTIFNLIAIAVSAYFSMMEMACVSFNKVRLQYYLSKGIKQAEWLNALLRKPARLFGTTLIGVNAANIISSECARETYSSLGLNPDLSALTQVALVVIFGELAPMFAARHYPEHVVMLGIRLLYISAIVMRPLLWLLSGISYACHWLIGGTKSDVAYYLTQEELLSIIEEPDKSAPRTESEEYNRIAYNIFQLRHLKTNEVMKPIHELPLLESKSTIDEMRETLKKLRCPFFPIYHRTTTKIVGIVFPRDVLRANGNHRVRDYSRTPWFITRTTTCMEILQQFRNNNQTVAIVLDNRGDAVGVITLDMLFEELIAFNEETENQPDETAKVIMNRTVSAQMKVKEFEKQFQVELDEHSEWTLEELMQSISDHHLEEGDVVIIEPYSLTVKEATMNEIKTVIVSTQL